MSTLLDSLVTGLESQPSAQGVLSLLHDEDVHLKLFALDVLNTDMNTMWTEVAGYVDQIETIYEDIRFPDRDLVALVLSKVYYHLRAYQQSLIFSLAAGKRFDMTNPTEYEETIISQSVDQWVAYCNLEYRRMHKQTEKPTNTITAEAALTSPTTPFSAQNMPSKSLLSRANPEDSLTVESELDTTSLKLLESRVLELFHLCTEQHKYRQVLGMIIEAKRLDLFPHVISKAQSDGNSSASQVKDLLDYSLAMCLDIVQERGFRTQFLQEILATYNSVEDPDLSAIAKCSVYLNDHDKASLMLCQLVEKGTKSYLAYAYQIAFDLYDNSTQEFLGKVIEALPHAKPKPAKSESEPTENDGLLKSETKAEEESEANSEHVKAFANIRNILDGSKVVKLNIEFLYRNNKADINILNKIRDSLESRNSIFHTALTFCNAFMNHGTTNDKFFRDNLDWLGKAVNWSKFTATAALGVIHRGNISQARRLLEPYLPKSTSTGSIYSQGGALYAYGLIHSNHGAGALEYLNTQFTEAVEEVILHGGALGLGIAGMATGSTEIFENLKRVLYTDSALNGEAVGLAMGLIMLGTGNEQALEDMMSYAHETSHEKTVRGLALGMSLIMFNRQEDADALVETLLADPNPALRYGGILMVAMAYCGTGSNKAVRKLLHTAVSDVSDDVRRVAVMSLGFVLFRKPSSVPRMVELLAESYNPHVRYGAAMALGISCAGTGLDDAIELLMPMVKDPSDFVRQGALISLATIMIQQNEVINPKVAVVRKILKKVVMVRHEDAMTRFGASLALGIIDAGGRNCTIGLQTQTGNLNMSGIVGMVVFTQYWYWFPFTHFLSLSFSPTSIIGLDQDLEAPALKFYCSARPSMFDYPPEKEVKVEEGPALVATAVLSTTAQAKRRAQRKERARRIESMDIDTLTSSKTPAAEDKMDVDEDKGKTETKEENEGNAQDEKKADETTPTEGKKREKAGFEIENMSRVLPSQLKYISFPDERYKPVKTPTGGILLLVDTKPEEPKNLLEETLRKVTIEKAPVAGGSGDRRIRHRNPRPSNRGNTIAELQDLLDFSQAAANQSSRDVPMNEGEAETSPQEPALADVAVEGEAPLPRPFDFFPEEDEEEEEEEEEEV